MRTRALHIFRRLTDERGRKLRTLSYSELAGMVNEPAEEVEVGGRKGTICLIVEHCDEEVLRIVLQGFLKSRWVPGLSTVALDGFYKHRDGSVTPMREDEFLKYD